MAVPTLPVVGFSLIIIAAKRICREVEKHPERYQQRMTANEYQQLLLTCDALKALLALTPFGG